MPWAAPRAPLRPAAEDARYPLHSWRHGNSFFGEPISDGWGWNDLFHDPEGPPQAYRMAGG